MPPPKSPEAPRDADLIERVRTGDFRAIARLVTLAESRPRDATPYLKALYPDTGRALTVGVTGAPGSGKSTLVDALATLWRSRGQKLGIVAVDPSSPFTGGAILGDRIRMQSRSVDTGTFIRSMATRGHLGGLARATSDAVAILDAAGFDTVLIETVGVGQDEIDIARTAGVTVVLLVPGMGDEIQAMKAGVMEIADVFVINKADRPGTERLETELAGLLDLSTRADGWRPPVVRTVASDGQGIEACQDAILAYRDFARASELDTRRAIAAAETRLLDLVRFEIADRFTRDAALALELRTAAEAVAARVLDPFSAAERLMSVAGVPASPRRE